MNLIITLVSIALLQSHTAMIEEAFQKADYAAAEKLIRTHIPESPRRSLFLARTALLRNETAKAQKHYNDVLKAPSASIREKTDAYVGLLRFLETNIYRNRKALISLCDNAIKELPEGSNVQRMFRIQQAAVYEVMIGVPAVGVLQHLLLPGYYLIPDQPHTKALKIYMDIINSKKPVPPQTLWKATYGAARIWRRIGQFEKAEALLQALWKSDLPMIERGTCAMALTEHYIATAPAWNRKNGALWNQINTFFTSKKIPPEYRGRILCRLGAETAKKGYYGEAFSYYNRAANNNQLTPSQRISILNQYISTANRYKQENHAYQARKRIYYDGRNGNWQRRYQLTHMIKYLAKQENRTEFNALLTYGTRSNLRFRAADLQQYRTMYNKEVQKLKKKR